MINLRRLIFLQNYILFTITYKKYGLEFLETLVNLDNLSKPIVALSIADL